MPITFPLPVRVAAGLLVSGVELARRLPSELPSMAVTAAGQAMRLSMKVQQDIAELAVKGDEVLSLIGGGPPENPAWATFDEDLPRAAPAPAATSGGAGADLEDEAIGGTGATGAIAGSNGVVATDMNESGGDPAAPSVVDLPSRSRRRASSTGPGNTRPSKAAAARQRPTPTADGPLADPAAPADSADPGSADADITELAALVPAAEGAAAEQSGGPDAAAATLPLPEPDLDLATDEPAADFSEDGDAASAAGGDGSAGSPLLGYDSLSLAELRGHLRRLSPAQVAELVQREQAGAARAPFLTLLENRLTSLELDGS